MKHFFLETLVAAVPGMAFYVIGAVWLLSGTMPG